MKTREFSKVVQDLVSKGDTGISHALELMMIVLSGRNCELCHEVMHLEQKFRRYQEELDDNQDIQDRSPIVFSLLGCVKKLSEMEEIDPQASMKIYAYLQAIQDEDQSTINIHDTSSSPSKLIGFLGIIGAFSLFFLGALLHRPTSKAIEVWMEAETDSLAIYGKLSRIPEVQLTEGLVAYYPFDFTSDDMGPSSHPMTNYGAEMGPDRFGKYDQAYHFDGRRSWMDLGNFKTGKDMSISMWVTIEKKDAGQALIACYDSKREMAGFSMVYSSGYLYTKIGSQVSHQQLLSSDNHHLVLTITAQEAENSKVRLYDNAELLWESTYPSALSQNKKGHWVLGKRWENQQSVDYFSGTMDELRIYDRPLNEAEIKALYTYERRAIHVAAE